MAATQQGGNNDKHDKANRQERPTIAKYSRHRQSRQINPQPEASAPGPSTKQFPLYRARRTLLTGPARQKRNLISPNASPNWKVAGTA